MTPIDTVKAGLKTAVVAFTLAVIAAVTGGTNELIAWFSDGDPVDLSGPAAILMGGVAALSIGLLNLGLRFVQVKAVPFVAAIVDKLLGAVPAYPEPDLTKTVVGPDPAAGAPAITVSRPTRG